jgi:hypothetical protein
MMAYAASIHNNLDSLLAITKIYKMCMEVVYISVSTVANGLDGWRLRVRFHPGAKTFLFPRLSRLALGLIQCPIFPWVQA